MKSITITIESTGADGISVRCQENELATVKRPSDVWFEGEVEKNRIKMAEDMPKINLQSMQPKLGAALALQSLGDDIDVIHGMPVHDSIVVIEGALQKINIVLKNLFSREQPK